MVVIRVISMLESQQGKHNILAVVKMVCSMEHENENLQCLLHSVHSGRLKSRNCKKS